MPQITEEQRAIVSRELERRAEEHRRHNLIDSFYPETGPLRRELYVKHCAFFEAGATYRERAALSGNRTGKTQGIGAYEVSVHLTGRYPSFWCGKRFTKPIAAWACGDTNITVRDIVQAKLVGKLTGSGDDGPVGLGTGMIPKDAIKGTRPKSGIPNALDSVYVKHISGGVSTLTFKSYEQGRKSFQGTEQELIWLDEECEEDIFDECTVRTMGTGLFSGGIIIATATPLSGWTNVVERFLNEEERIKGNRYVVQIGWDDAPHLSEKEKAELLAKLPPHQRDARRLGIPQLGSGAIYPIGESEISCEPFEIPNYWPRAYALDVGWNRTAALWGALNRESDTLVIYGEHYFAHSEPGENARAIKARGEWIPGVIDPASRGRSQVDGTQLLESYCNLGLNLAMAINAREAGIYAVWERMVSGRLKVFKSCANFFKEFRLYRRDEKGRIVKANDHLMDCLRYYVMSGVQVAETVPVKPDLRPNYWTPRDQAQGWMN
jgi:phage terminase large subunit-like protein